jgi:hypothetical protein
LCVKVSDRRSIPDAQDETADEDEGDADPRIVRTDRTERRVLGEEDHECEVHAHQDGEAVLVLLKSIFLISASHVESTVSN